MDNTTVSIIAGVVLLGFVGLYLYFYRKDKNSIAAATKAAPAEAQKENGPSKQMQLAAYERLVILADRIALPNLISRTNDPSFDKRSMQQLLTQTIKQEFEYNLSQQIYVSAAAWDAIRNLKEQNIMIVNQLGAILPDDLSGLEFNKKIVEFVMNQPQGSMHGLVQEALSYEAKKLLS
ncbi:hypothetical protein [Flavihumibacter sp. CACIAM 22H1]|uniref:DUF7935 family protein n=1 Tax=Flavihumibacter sp. CACIAM 22H1 TaxID=1812911 RepID=UPI0007A7C910|nr:hypothetical protein [Flavihumibacter sp. CACIAM 22H1]KYP14918.1 MAG: hypothetical protein A1D16_03360 [Flavihumibacter sp. CACIAM 22H1]